VQVNRLRSGHRARSPAASPGDAADCSGCWERQTARNLRESLWTVGIAPSGALLGPCFFGCEGYVQVWDRNGELARPAT